jgi:hypothetical protein
MFALKSSIQVFGFNLMSCEDDWLRICGWLPPSFHFEISCRQGCWCGSRPNWTLVDRAVRFRLLKNVDEEENKHAATARVLAPLLFSFA